jgi:hypothetical protein
MLEGKVFQKQKILQLKPLLVQLLRVKQPPLKTIQLQQELKVDLK